jgi:hypothetical protein
MVDVLGFVVGVLVLAVPGFGLTLAVAGAGELPLETRMAVALPTGAAFVGALLFVLMVAHALVAGAAIAVLTVGTVAVWVIGLRRSSFREHAHAWGAELRPDRWILLVTAVLALAFVGVHLTYGPSHMVQGTSLRYWADGTEIADAHSVPASTLQWDALIPPTTSKSVLNATNAGVSLLFGREPTHALAILLAVDALGLFLAGFGVARTMGLRRTAPLVPVLLFATTVVGGGKLAHLTYYVAEDWGRLIVLGAVILVVRMIRTATGPQEEQLPRVTRIGLMSLAASMLGLAAATHLVALAVGGLFLVCYGVGALVALPSRRRWIGLAGLGALVFAVVTAVVLFLPRGDIGFAGAARSSDYQRIDRDLGLPPSFDPTQYIVQGTGTPPPRDGSFYYSPSKAYREFASDIVGGSATRERRGGDLAGVGLLLAALVLAVFGTRPLRAVAIACALFAIGLLVVGLIFLARYHLFALADFGRRRLFGYVAVPVVLLLAALVETALERIAGGSPSSRRDLVLTAVACAVAVVVAALAYPNDVARTSRNASTIQLADWIRANVPCQGRILADRRTLGTFQSMAGRAGVLEGMGPHVRPSILELAIRELFEARTFFLNPTDHSSYLRRRGVALVVVSSSRDNLGGWIKVAPNVRFAPPAGRSQNAADYPQTGSASLPQWSATASFKRLAADPALRLAYVSPGAMAFVVRGFRPDPRLPDVSSQPGYACR